MKALGRLAIPAIVVVLALGGWWAWTAHDARAQHRALSALVAEASADMKKWVDGTPTNEQIIAAEGRLEALASMRKSRQRDFAEATELYLVGARALVQRRADAARLAQHAEASRRALAAHMAGAARRDPGWIGQATELRRRADQAYGDLKRSLEAVAELTYGMPASTDALAQFMPRSALIDAAVFDAAHKRSEQQAQRAAEQQEQTGRLPVPR